MSTRAERERVTNLDKVLELLKDPNKVGKNQVWVGEDYSLRDLILDLRSINDSLTMHPQN